MVRVIEHDAPFGEVVEELVARIAENGMAVIARIDVQKNARKMGMEIGPNEVLEVFRPDYAARVWEAEIDAGVDIPVRIHVHEAPDGRVQVRYRVPSETFAPYDNEALSFLGAELDPIFARTMKRG